MTEDMPETAPDLGEPSDVSVGDEAPVDPDQPPAVEHDVTMQTPDELGGTGGEQAGGAG